MPAETVEPCPVEEQPIDETRITVFHDPLNYTVKHPLQSAWTLWYDNPSGKSNVTTWSSNLKEIITFDTVEDYWGVFNTITKASGLASGASYHLFKQGIQPTWEDKANRQGGKWIYMLPKNAVRDQLLDEIFQNLTMACIGEAFDGDDEICGCVVSLRARQDRVALWTKTSNDRALTESIGIFFKKLLQVDKVQIGFQVHADAMKAGSSYSNPDRYSV